MEKEIEFKTPYFLDDDGTIRNGQNEIVTEILDEATEYKELHLMIEILNGVDYLRHQLNTATAREARLVEALELFADPENWDQQQFESYDGDGIERVGFRYTFNDGDVDSDPITIAAEALAEYRGEK